MSSPPRNSALRHRDLPFGHLGSLKPLSPGAYPLSSVTGLNYRSKTSSTMRALLFACAKRTLTSWGQSCAAFRRLGCERGLPL